MHSGVKVCTYVRTYSRVGYIIYGRVEEGLYVRTYVHMHSGVKVCTYVHTVELKYVCTYSRVEISA